MIDAKELSEVRVNNMPLCSWIAIKQLAIKLFVQQDQTVATWNYLMTWKYKCGGNLDFYYANFIHYVALTIGDD